MSTNWSKICTSLQKTLKTCEYKVWITPLKGSVVGDVVCIVAPSAYAADWVEGRFSASLREAAADVLGIAIQDVQLKFSVENALHMPRTAQENDKQGLHTLRSIGQRYSVPVATPTAQQDVAERSDCAHLVSEALQFTSSSKNTTQATLPMPAQSPLSKIRWRYDFDDFVVGPSNAMAVAAAQDICRSNGHVETLFVSAASGLGKTHLIHAIGQSLAKEQGGKARVGYLTAEDFTSHFVRASRQHHMDTFKHSLRELDVLLLDDVHFFQGKEKTQDEALATIKYLQSQGSRVVLTSSFTPRELQNLDSQLVSHFCSGLLTSIDKPTKDMRRSILSQKARNHQVILSDKVTEVLVDHLRDDVRQLESCLANLVFKARHLKSVISLEMAMDVLAQYAKIDAFPDIDKIIELVCNSFGFKVSQLSSRSRRKEYVLARDTIYYLARKHTEISLQDLGERFNRRHSTVIKGIAAIERELQKETTCGRQIAKTVHMIEKNAGLSMR